MATKRKGGKKAVKNDATKSYNDIIKMPDGNYFIQHDTLPGDPPYETTYMPVRKPRKAKTGTKAKAKTGTKAKKK